MASVEHDTHNKELKILTGKTRFCHQAQKMFAILNGITLKKKKEDNGIQTGLFCIN